MRRPLVDTLIDLLRQALECPDERITKVKEFQRLVWEAEENEIQPSERWLWDIFDDLAADLEYYEPNEVWRKESPLFFGDEKVRQLIEEALSRIHEGKPSYTNNLT